MRKHKLAKIAKPKPRRKPKPKRKTETTGYYGSVRLGWDYGDDPAEIALPSKRGR